MDESLRNRLALRARIFKALAHPTRLLFVHALAERPRPVLELTDLAGVDVSTVSRHLRILKEAGILADRRKGTQVYYRLLTPCVLNFFSCVEETLRTQARARNRLTRTPIHPKGKKK